MAKKHRNHNHLRSFHPRTDNQRHYVNAIEDNDIVFGFGPAGTGKTFLAAVEAAKRYDDGEIIKIVICRPIVEAFNEDLGYLPGGVRDKCDPYTKPILDVFEQWWLPGEVKTMQRNGTIEVVPLAYMRGRTFSESFVIADEMQNANEGQMNLLLTRLGYGTKMVVTGDPKQRDKYGVNGYEIAKERLIGCPDIEFVQFDRSDIVRHKTVQNILNRWEATGTEWTTRENRSLMQQHTPSFMKEPMKEAV